jgi:hypothetical protein
MVSPREWIAATVGLMARDGLSQRCGFGRIIGQVHVSN